MSYDEQYRLRRYGGPQKALAADAFCVRLGRYHNVGAGGTRTDGGDSYALGLNASHKRFSQWYRRTNKLPYQECWP